MDLFLITILLIFLFNLRNQCWPFILPNCSFLRSQEVALCEIYIPAEICYSFISKMGEYELLEFIDVIINLYFNLFKDQVSFK